MSALGKRCPWSFIHPARGRDSAARSHERPELAFGFRPDATTSLQSAHDFGIATCGLSEVARAHARQTQKVGDLSEEIWLFFSHAPIVSAIEDTSSVRDRGCATGAIFPDNRAMEANNWRERLAQAVEASGMSRRAGSLSAGNGPGYVHSILAEGKDPSVAPPHRRGEGLTVAHSNRWPRAAAPHSPASAGLFFADSGAD